MCIRDSNNSARNVTAVAARLGRRRQRGNYGPGRRARRQVIDKQLEQRRLLLFQLPQLVIQCRV